MRNLFRILIVILSIAPAIILAQSSSKRLTVATLTPRQNTADARLLTSLHAELEKEFDVIDSGISASALGSFTNLQPFNMSLDEARNLGEAIGSDVLLILETSTQARSGLESGTRQEAFSSIYIVSGKTGRLAEWRLFSETDSSVEDSFARLLGKIPLIADWITTEISKLGSEDVAFVERRKVALLEDFSTSGIRPPAPYRRISPNYSEELRLYGKEGTVEVEVDLDSNGDLIDVRVIRWAGHGLDAEVIRAVREMNWRPAHRNETPIPSRFLLRYNFTRKND